jgi:ubiquinone/menaquinone biosynthesis C-methylase UbiE
MEPTKRFSNRVDYYIKFRPGYPIELVTYLTNEGILKNNDIIADIGSGTGKLSELFLKEGNTVYGVEPNQEMREAGEKLLGNYKNFISIDAVAEDTTLQANSIDIITAAQAFHWFDPVKTKFEFRKILKNYGWILLIWNTWENIKSDFTKEYKRLLIEYGTDYKEVRNLNQTQDLIENFLGRDYNFKKFKNVQLLDEDGFKGRLLSASYAPMENDSGFEKMMEKLMKIYKKYNNNGLIEFEYETVIYSGRLIK